MTVTTDRTQAAKKRTRPFVVISSDTHVGQSTFADFTSYIDPSFREDYKIWADAQGTNQFAMTDASRKGHDNQTEAKGKSANAELRRRFVEGFSKGVDEPDPVRRAFKILMLAQGNNPDVVDEWAEHYSTDTVNGGGDSAKRLQLLEKQGVVGEVSLPGGAIAGVAPAARPAMANFRGDEDVEFIWVQMQAYNRWLRDFSDAAPGRRATPIMVNLNDLEAAIAELRWARNAGMFGGVLLPQMSIASGLPGYADPYYEPLWSACEDLDAPLNLHVGVDPNDAALYGSDMQVVQRLNGYEMFYLSRRPMWFMILGGVFDRHPKLKLCIIENHAEWVPDALAEMQGQFTGFGGRSKKLDDENALKLLPHEYFERNVFLGASIMRRSTADMRHAIGVDNIMWGADYPHPEGATPYLNKAMRHLFGGLPEDDVRKMLGENVAKVYGFDMDLLSAVADSVGPTVEDLADQLPASAVPSHASPTYH